MSECLVSLSIAWLALVVFAAVVRNPFYAAFAGANAGIAAMVVHALLPNVSEPAAMLMWGGFGLLLLHLAVLTRPKLRSTAWRALVSLPGLTFVAGCLLAVPWAVASAIGFEPVGWWLPFLATIPGVVQSLRNPRNEVHLAVDGDDNGPLSRHALSTPGGDTLNIIQITDPHLGPFMSVERLREICARAVDADPDLVLITGDLLTMESHGDVQGVVRAFEPLLALEGRVFACLGNHDLEALATVKEAMGRVGARLLIDEMSRIETRHGPVEIVGANFVFVKRREHLEGLFASLPERDSTPRLLMLHDPGAFKYVPDGAADITFSGHTHGGHIGLLSIGSNWTSIGAFGVPDHGLWSKGRNKLYVHRGTGHYGYPIRLGVPGEESVIRVAFTGSGCR